MTSEARRNVVEAAEKGLLTVRIELRELENRLASFAPGVEYMALIAAMRRELALLKARLRELEQE